MQTTTTFAQGSGAQDHHEHKTDDKGGKSETLTLRLVPRRHKKKEVSWTQDTEEINEHSGKMKSKKCCIFHKRRVFGDWSDDDSDDEECQDCNPPGGPSQPGGPGQPGPSQPPPPAPAGV